jgi:hypothetical protein
MFIMLYDLEGELDSVKFTYQTMKDTIPESVTKDDFNSLCKKLIVEARDTPASSSTSTTANAARKTENQRGRRGRGRGRRGRGGGHNTSSDTKTDTKTDGETSSFFKNGPAKGKTIDQ